MRFNNKRPKTRKHFCWLPTRAQSNEYVFSQKVWLEWVEVGYTRYGRKVYYLIEK